MQMNDAPQVETEVATFEVIDVPATSSSPPAKKARVDDEPINPVNLNNLSESSASSSSSSSSTSSTWASSTTSSITNTNPFSQPNPDAAQFQNPSIAVAPPSMSAAALQLQQLQKMQYQQQVFLHKQREKERRRARQFTSDIEDQMYGFGDKYPQNSGAVAVVESLVEEYIANLTARAEAVAQLRGKLDKECFMFVVRKDRAKFNRVHALLKANEEIKSVRQMEFKEQEGENEENNV